jgi:hypothetical protein
MDQAHLYFTLVYSVNKMPIAYSNGIKGIDMCIYHNAFASMYMRTHLRIRPALIIQDISALLLALLLLLGAAITTPCTME